MSKFIDDFMVKLYGKIPNEYLEVINLELSTHCEDYSIEKSCKEIVPYNDCIPECFKIFLVERVIRGLAEGTIKNNKAYLEHFFETVRKPLDKITTNDIRLYLYNVQKMRKLKTSSIDSRRAALSAFFKWANENGHVLKNVCAPVKPFKNDSKPRSPLTAEEREIVRDACKTLREQVEFELLYSTGCRVGELYNLKWEDINFTTLDVTFFGKGKKWKTIPMSERACMLLKRYREEIVGSGNEYVLVDYKTKSKHITVRAIQRELAKIGERSGVGRRLFPHLLRHTNATELINRGMPIQEVQISLGHSNIKTTMVYAHVDVEQTKIDHRKYIA